MTNDIFLQLGASALFFMIWLALTVLISLGIRRGMRSEELAYKRYRGTLSKVFGSAKVYGRDQQPVRLPERLQRELNGLLQQPSSYIGVQHAIDAKNWAFYDVGWVTVFACRHQCVSPYIIARRDTLKGNVARFWVDRMDDDSLVLCEGIVDKDFDIYCHEESEVDTLAILSPEVLDVLRGAPYGASIILKRDVVYYVLTGSRQPLEIQEKLLSHAQDFITQLDENLQRWSRSMSNAAKISAIKTELIGPTDRELSNDPSQGYFTKY